MESTATAATAKKLPILPREHGAWAMLLQPFLGALIVLQRLSWAVIPVLAAVVLVFLVREPLIVLARQQWVWRVQKPETAAARRYLIFEFLLLGAAGAWLLSVWSFSLLAVLGGGAAVLTGLAVYMTIKNRQRSIWLQVLSAAGLSSSCIAACLAVAGTIPQWCWWWWGLHFAHFLAGILVVHVRLEARVAARKGRVILSGEYLGMRREASVIEAGFLGAALYLFATGKFFFGAAAVLSAAFHFWDLYHAHTASAVAMPMMTVGKRALAMSIAFSLLAVAGSLYAIQHS